MEEIKVKCKRCNKEWDAEKLVLDPVYKMMVCPQCVQERIQPSKKPKEMEPQDLEPKITPEKKKPAGWDEDDELLEKLNKQKEIIQKDQQKPKVNYERIDADNLRVQCPKCSYKFKYDLNKNSPKSCPYCNLKIQVK